jgi:hypothetical protein
MQCTCTTVPFMYTLPACPCLRSGPIQYSSKLKVKKKGPTSREKYEAIKAIAACAKASYILSCYATCVQNIVHPKLQKKKHPGKGYNTPIPAAPQRSSYRYHFNYSSQSPLHTNTARLCPGSSAGHTTDTGAKRKKKKKTSEDETPCAHRSSSSQHDSFIFSSICCTVYIVHSTIFAW